MPRACVILEQFEPIGDEPPPVVADGAPPAEPETITGLRAMVADLQAKSLAMARRLAELEPSVLIPLKAAASDAGLPYETARRWCTAHLVTAERDHGRWLADPTSLSARKQRLSAAPRK